MFRSLQRIGGGPLIQPTPKNRALYVLTASLLGPLAYHFGISAANNTPRILVPFSIGYILGVILLNKVLFGIWFPFHGGAKYAKSIAGSSD